MVLEAKEFVIGNECSVKQLRDTICELTYSGLEIIDLTERKLGELSPHPSKFIRMIQVKSALIPTDIPLKIRKQWEYFEENAAKMAVSSGIVNTLDDLFSMAQAMSYKHFEDSGEATSFLNLRQERLREIHTRAKNLNSNPRFGIVTALFENQLLKTGLTEGRYLSKLNLENMLIIKN